MLSSGANRKSLFGEVGLAVFRTKIRTLSLRRLALPPHRRRGDGGIVAAADRGELRRLAVGYLQRLVKIGQTAETRCRAKTNHPDEACRLTKAPNRRGEACRPKPFRLEAGYNEV
jgi:hypothetical protein